MSKRKWEIKDLRTDFSFCESAKVILSKRLINLLNSITLFFQNETVENLHDVRIALRRLRYNMELFTICFDNKKFVQLYKEVERLQDLSGDLRDLDVLTLTINSLIINDKTKISKKVLKKIDEKKKLLKGNLKLELMKFTHSKPLKNFNSLVSKL